MGGAYFYLELSHLCPSGGSIHPLILIWWVPSHAPDLTSGFISSKDSSLSPNQKLCPSPTITLCYFTLLIKFISLTAMHGYLLPCLPLQVWDFFLSITVFPMPSTRSGMHWVLNTLSIQQLGGGGVK